MINILQQFSFQTVEGATVHVLEVNVKKKKAALLNKVIVISTRCCARDGKGKRVEFIRSSFPMLAV